MKVVHEGLTHLVCAYSYKELVRLLLQYLFDSAACLSGQSDIFCGSDQFISDYLLSNAGIKWCSCHLDRFKTSAENSKIILQILTCRQK